MLIVMTHRTPLGPRPRSARDGELARAPLPYLLDEVRLLWHVMSQVAERLHEEEAVTLGMRAVLELLATFGPATVPDMARRRRVSRQHIQLLVSELAKRGLVATAPNPAHRRSGLIELTGEGRVTFERMSRREQRYLERLTVPGGDEAVTRSAATLSAVRELMEVS